MMSGFPANYGTIKIRDYWCKNTNITNDNIVTTKIEHLSSACIHAF